MFITVEEKQSMPRSQRWGLESAFRVCAIANYSFSVVAFTLMAKVGFLELVAHISSRMKNGLDCVEVTLP